MKVALVSGAYPRREVVARGASHKLGGDPVTPFSCVEDVLMSSMDYDVFVVYNNFEKKMNGVDGVRALRKQSPQAYIVGVSSVPYMERQFVPAGADRFLLLAGNEIAELGEVLLKIKSGGARPPSPPPSTSPLKSSTGHSTDSELLADTMIHTLERARLLLDYASGDHDSSELRRYAKMMVAEIEQIITHYYAAHPSPSGGPSARK